MQLLQKFLGEHNMSHKYEHYLFSEIEKTFSQFEDEMSEEAFTLLLNEIRSFIISNYHQNEN
jgi:hypothetical protein